MMSLLAPLLPLAAAYAPHASARLHRRAAVSTMQMPADYNPEVGGIGTAVNVDTRPPGTHGTGYRFMPLTSLPNEPAPMLVAIAGAYPGLTAEQLLAPKPLPFPEVGKWNYHRLVADGMPTGFVALPGSELVMSRPDTVAVVCTSGSLGVELADGGQHEVLALIDRADEAVSDMAELSSEEFYAFADAEGRVHIRWIDELPAGWRVLGRMLFAQLPNVKRPGSTGGFAELDDNFEF